MKYLVAYDITDKKRLTKVHRLLQNWGIPLQKSVFIVNGALDIDFLQKDIRKLIEEKTDDVRIYPIFNSSLVWEWDDKSDSEGILILE